MKQKPKTPKLLTFLLSQINKGNIPTKDELLDVFEELPQRYYKDVALALLEQEKRKPKQKVVQKPVESNNIPDTGLTTSSHRPQGIKTVEPSVSPTKVHTPGSLTKGSNVLGNS